MKTHGYRMPGLPAVAGALVLAVLLVGFIGVQQAAAQVNGAIFTSVCDGSKVNANLYDDRRDVYLSGGPQPPACGQAAGLSPDGDYYFQVTDPSGATLLSTDPLNCRVVTVTDGVIVAYHPDSSCPAGVSEGCAVRSEGPHNLGTGPCVVDFPGQVSVQLFPFGVTPNNGGVYKAWAMPVVDLPAGCDASQVDPGNCGDSVHGFVDADSKTDNFRVKEENPPAETGEIDVFKFCDANANGILDPAELSLGLKNWQITFTPDPNSCSGLTDSNGLLACANLGAATYSIAETVQAGFKHTATCVDGSCGTGACSLTAGVCTSDAECPSGETCIVPPPGTDFTSIAVAVGDTHNVDFGNVGLSTISGRKFDDRNANGVDNSEAGIAGVKVLLTGTAANGTAVSLCTITASNGSYSFPDLLPGTYTVSEVKPPGTIATTPTSCQEQLTPDATCAGTTETCNFGNVCLGAGGGLTLGFWSNKNGQALFGTDDLAAMVALNLRNANGTPFDPTSYSQFRTWLLSANATNMAYMLSAQLAAMKLNTMNGSPPFVSPSAMVFAGTAPAGCTVPGLSTLGFITIGDLIAAANTASNHSLATDGNTTAAGAARTCQEFMKNALDSANNNLNFVVACPTNFGAICQ